MNWEIRPLGSVADLCLGKMLDQKKNKGVPRPYLANINVRWGSFDLSDLREMRFEDKELDRYGLRDGDIVMCEGGEPGRCAIWRGQLPGVMFQKALHRIRPHPSVDTGYLYYALLLKGRSGGMDSYFTGATIKHLPGEQLAKIEVALPPLEVQRRIAGILGAYDDLIEVNWRRIAVLEEMARGLFTEWFIRLRFPGHEDVAIEDTSDGRLPAGWYQATLGSLLEHTVGGLWGEASETDTEDQRVSVIRGTDFPRLLSGNYSGVPDRFVASRELRSRAFLPGDLILEASGGSKDQPVGRVMYVTASLIEKLRPPVAPASFCRLLRPSDKLGGGAYLYGLLQAMYQDKRIEKFQKQSTGLRNLSMKQLAAETVTVPDASILASFGKSTVPFLETASLHRHECSTLSAARDLLLPRLISGQLSITQAEQELEAVA